MANFDIFYEFFRLISSVSIILLLQIGKLKLKYFMVYGLKIKYT